MECVGGSGQSTLSGDVSREEEFVDVLWHRGESSRLGLQGGCKD